MQCSILIVVRKPELTDQIKAILTSRGYLITDTCSSGMQGLRSAASHPADIAIVGFSLPDMSGLEFAGDLLEKCDCSVMLLTPADQIDYVNQQAKSMDVVALQRPATAQALLSTLELMLHYRSRIKKVSDEAQKLRGDLDRRALAEKAKVLLMRKLAMSEAEAWRYLQKRAMDTGRTLRDISTQVLEQYKS